MGITQFILERKVFAYFFASLLLVGGIFSFLSLGQLEDPDFTVKTGMVITSYPGASPEQVELEVTDRLEKAIQEIPAVRYLISWSRPGVSAIRIEVKQEYWEDRLPQVWNELRHKIRDVTPQLPPGVGAPEVLDDFSFVYGFVLGITGDGYSYKELEDYADSIKKELSVVPGVARVELWGTQDKVIYLDASQTQIANFGLTDEDVALTMAIQNKVVDAGSLDIADRRVRVAPTGEFRSPEEIGSLQVRTSLRDTLTNVMRRKEDLDSTAPGTSELIRVEDVATVRPGYMEPPRWLMRYNEQPALAIQVANVAGGNIVDTGHNLDRRLDELMEELPVGVELHKIAWQSDLVTSAIDSFMLSLVEAIAIVLVVLMIPSGFRMGLIIGSMLIFIILGTLIFMAIMGIDLQRMSLGALIIALGMMVDNS
ncbi:MAG: efflux RND transporter permease subunit, partial [Planctomycetota bacterium]